MCMCVRVSERESVKNKKHHSVTEIKNLDQLQQLSI